MTHIYIILHLQPLVDAVIVSGVKTSEGQSRRREETKLQRPAPLTAETKMLQK